MKLRSSNKAYETAVRQYFDKLLPILRDHQFTKGGSIIGFQVGLANIFCKFLMNLYGEEVFLCTLLVSSCF